MSPRKSQIPSCHATLGPTEIRNGKSLAVLGKQRISQFRLELGKQCVESQMSFP